MGENPAVSAVAHDTESPRDILVFRPDLNPELAKAIMKCLSANPVGRPQAVSEFSEMLRDLPADAAG
jgi:hypothetical protein